MARLKLIWLLVIVIAIVVASIPIWQRHPGFNGVEHGHPLWAESHVH